MKYQLANLNIEEIRKDFPILTRQINNKPLIYLDNASTTQKPRSVIQAINDYYSNYNANVHRSIYKISEEATIAYEKAHQKVANFINSKFPETIFTSGTTESINLVAYGLKDTIKEGNIVISEAEHHSNFVPWQQLAKNNDIELRFIKLNEDKAIDINHASSLIDENTNLVSISHVSNVLGVENDVKQLSKLTHENNALFVVDVAQSVPHQEVDVKSLNADFLAFSGHKMLASTGIGVLYGKQELLEKMNPFLYGGDMIKSVSFKETTFNDLPWKFEAGTPKIIQGISLGKAIEYLEKNGMNNINNYCNELAKYTIEKLSEIEGLKIYSATKNNIGIIAFNLNNIHSHDLSALLDEYGIAVRSGHHCTMPLMSKLGIPGTARASLYFYNTQEEIDILIKALNEVKKVFK